MQPAAPPWRRAGAPRPAGISDDASATAGVAAPVVPRGAGRCKFEAAGTSTAFFFARLYLLQQVGDTASHGLYCISSGAMGNCLF